MSVRNDGVVSDHTAEDRDTSAQSEIEQMRSEMAELRLALRQSREGGQPSGVFTAASLPSRIVLPPPVKLPTYSGKEDPDIWIERATRTIATQQLQGESAVLFLRDYLLGTAEVEIRQQVPDTPDNFFRILRKVFGCRATEGQILRDFLNRFQSSSDSITEYAHELVSLIAKTSFGAAEREQRLKSQFADGVRPPSLRLFLQSRVRDREGMTFAKLRDVALDECIDTSCNKAQVREQVIEKHDIPEWASQLINLTTELVRNTRSSPPAPHQYSRNVNPTNDAHTKVNLLCFYCSKPGHFKKDCMKRLRDQQRRDGCSLPTVAADVSSESITQGAVSSNSCPNMVGDCPEIIAEVSGVSIVSLFDTGSQVTTITEKCYRRDLASRPLESVSGLQLKAANGLELPYVGLITANVKVMGTMVEDVGVLVLKDRSDLSGELDRRPGIIGMNVLGRVKAFRFCSSQSTSASLDVVQKDSKLPRVAVNHNVCVINAVGTDVTSEPDCTTRLPSWDPIQMAKFQQKDPVISRLLHYRKLGRKPTAVERRAEKKPTRQLIRQWERVVSKDGVLYRERSTGMGCKNQCLILPICLQGEVLHDLHDSLGHQGAERTESLLRDRYWFADLSQHVQTYLESCGCCVRANGPCHPVTTLEGHLGVSTPLDDVAIEHTVLGKARLWQVRQPVNERLEHKAARKRRHHAKVRDYQLTAEKFVSRFSNTGTEYKPFMERTKVDIAGRLVKQIETEQRRYPRRENARVHSNPFNLPRSILN